jgi:hypothetical protein
MRSQLPCTVAADRLKQASETQIATGMNVATCNTELIKTWLDLTYSLTLTFYRDVQGADAAPAL